MSELELILLTNSDNCTLYTIKFLEDSQNEFQKFVSKFREDATYGQDYEQIAIFLDQIIKRGALERYFRPEGKMRDHVVALPTIGSKLRLYCLRMSDKILIIGNGGVKSTRTYGEDKTLAGFVLTLQKFEELLKQGQKDGYVIITKSSIQTDRTFGI